MNKKFQLFTHVLFLFIKNILLLILLQLRNKYFPFDKIN